MLEEAGTSIFTYLHRSLTFLTSPITYHTPHTIPVHHTGTPCTGIVSHLWHGMAALPSPDCATEDCLPHFLIDHDIAVVDSVQRNARIRTISAARAFLVRLKQKRTLR